ncbi:hypothetical protein HanXRQr2_Chr02g0067171 [Helianthus annuus]|uniref:Uncharacterized protein n=1 Tax=Helianthus annuus TaxID=4232 RepID=A0A9K3JP64_HELAN|nr:hypothetical protein HanXRQr2_Chr02g0067171 [Helianthus annuus]KAJ0951918.1 hypothetical protein HanPSC8_Chr02g0066021 [Helianthus annuus]
MRLFRRTCSFSINRFIIVFMFVFVRVLTNNGIRAHVSNLGKGRS